MSDQIDRAAEVDRLRAGIEALARNYRNHYEMHGAAGDDYVVEDGRCVDVDDLLALLNPTEGEVDEQPCCRYCGEPGSDHHYPCC